jgi:hypothetical protein
MRWPVLLHLEKMSKALLSKQYFSEWTYTYNKDRYGKTQWEDSMGKFRASFLFCASTIASSTAMAQGT